MLKEQTKIETKIETKIKIHSFRPGGKRKKKKKEKTNWTAKPFLKTGLMVLNGPLAVGKLSLCANIALANRQVKELYPGGPKGDGRQSFFFSGGMIEAGHVFNKLGPDSGVKIIESIQEGDKKKIFEENPFDVDFVRRFIKYKGLPPDMEDSIRADGGFLPHPEDTDVKFKVETNYKTLPLILENMLKVIKRYNPAFAFFCLRYITRHEHLKSITKILNEFMDEVKNINTTIIGLTTTIAHLTELKSLPILNIKKTGEDRLLIKKSGFSDLPHGALRFKIKYKEDHFSACGLEYFKNLSQVKSSRESQEARLMEKVAKLIAKGQPVPTAQFKDEARQAGISLYRLNQIHWPNHGLQTKGQGFGGNYRQVLVPIQKH